MSVNVLIPKEIFVTYSACRMISNRASKEFEGGLAEGDVLYSGSKFTPDTNDQQQPVLMKSL